MWIRLWDMLPTAAMRGHRTAGESTARPITPDMTPGSMGDGTEDTMTHGFMIHTGTADPIGADGMAVGMTLGTEDGTADFTTRGTADGTEAGMDPGTVALTGITALTTGSTALHSDTAEPPYTTVQEARAADSPQVPVRRFPA